MKGQARLIMGEGQAEEIRELHRKMRVWLAQEYHCPRCTDNTIDGDFPAESLRSDPDLNCPLCEGLGAVTGHQIEEYAIRRSDRSLLPAWWPQFFAQSSRAAGTPLRCTVARFKWLSSAILHLQKL